jgi:glucose/arabinose dehydrogenase
LYYVICEGKNTGCENRVYRYDLDNKNNILINPKLLLSIPSFPDPAHIGGIIDIGPDNNLYVTVGNFQHTIPSEVYRTKTQNYEDGKPVDGRAGVLRITQDGKPVGEGIIGNEYPLNLYYAYGVKNSFGIDFDPVTGKLWLTENGPKFGDEINLAEPGFNSGSDKIFGIWRVNEEGKKLQIDGNKEGEYVTVGNNPKDLVYFEGKGHYSPPEFTWDKSVAPTALLFLDSKNLGAEYENDMFVGSVDGQIFHFDLNDNRTALLLKGVLEDKIASDDTEFADILFAEGFSIITDLKQGPDGNLYVVSALKQSKSENVGAVYRIK